MSSDNGKLKEGDLVTCLIQDISDIHERTSLHINEIDDKVHKSIALVQQGKMEQLPHLEQLRVELWICYAAKSIEKIGKLIGDLSFRLVKVASYKKQINDIKRRFVNLKSETDDNRISGKGQYLVKIIGIFNECTSLWNTLVDNEEDLRREAWMSFLSKIFLPFAGVVSLAYWALAKLIFGWNNTGNIILGWILVLFILYFLLLRWAENPFRLDSNT